MGLFKRVKAAAGVPDRDLLAHGIARRAGILAAASTGQYVGVGREPVMEFTLTVAADGDFYQVSHKQLVPFTAIGRAGVRGAVIVRVDPHNRERLVIDWTADPEQALHTVTPGTDEAALLEAVAGIPGDNLERMAKANQDAYAKQMTEPATVRILTVTQERTVGALRMVHARIAVAPIVGDPFECDFRSLVSDRIHALMLPGAIFPGRFATGRRDDADIDFPAEPG
ncbi:MAG: hypothetical protein ABR604_04850 [Jatrophihabitantaceae bacterium]